MLKPDQIRTRIEQMLQQGPFAGLSEDLRLAMRSQLNALLTSADIVPGKNSKCRPKHCVAPLPVWQNWKR